MDMKDFKFNKVGGPYGDQCCDYALTVPEGATLQDLFDFIVTQNEWGSIRIDYDITKAPIAHYNKQTLTVTCRFDDKMLDKKIKRVHASGGWSLMNYVVDLEK